MSEEGRAGKVPHWPADWPNRQCVDLDNLGDAGVWIEDQIPNAAEILFDQPDDDDDLADALAEAYISAATDMVFPLPSEFDGAGEEARQMIKGDFLSFIREWRRLALIRRRKDAAE